MFDALPDISYIKKMAVESPVIEDRVTRGGLSLAKLVEEMRNDICSDETSIVEDVKEDWPFLDFLLKEKEAKRKCRIP